MAGFEDFHGDTSTVPYSLEDQITLFLQCLRKQTIPSGPRKGQMYDSITLIGHSIGSYILLELIRRTHQLSSPIKITAGILLFPTVTHISQSPSGVKITQLFRIQDFPRKASIAAKALVALAPIPALRWLVGLVTGMPAQAAVVTTSFLKSRIGVWQALHMARDEMETITEDNWGEEIWGVEHEDLDQKQTPPKLVFYFGQNVSIIRLLSCPIPD